MVELEKMLQNNLLFKLFAFVTLASKLGAQNLSAEDELEAIRKEAMTYASATFVGFTQMFDMCVKAQMPKKDFIIDNVKGFINPSRTTVGVGPKLTTNRKFFANLIATEEFKHMLDTDSSRIVNNYIQKQEHCDNVIMNQNMIIDFYDREVDQTKL